MKVDHLTEEELRQYRRRTMPSPALLEADDHLARCSECRRSLERTEPDAAGDVALWRALTAAEPPSQQHLSHEELLAFAQDQGKGRGSAADRRKVTEHLESCADCRADSEDLSRFRAELEDRPKPDRITNIRRRPAWFVPVWAGAAAVILIGIFVGLRFYRGTGQPQPNVVAQLTDAGGAIRLDSSGRLVTPAPLEAADAAKIKDALISRRIEPAAVLTQLASPPGQLLGGPTGPSRSALVAPVATAVASDQPVLRWRPFGDFGQYVISIYDARYQKVAQSPSLRQTEWRPDHPLPRGSIYTWQVMADSKHGPLRAPVPPEPEARFEVLPQSEADQLEKAQRERPGSHLLLGILYAQAGALDDSERELTALLAANPHSDVAKNLLASVQQLRRKS
jgi:hypothetical protein